MSAAAGRFETVECKAMSSTTVWFGTLGSPSARWRPLSPKAWTCVGALAIPLWATWPALALRALEIPAFECLSIAFLFGWFILAGLERPSANGAKDAAAVSWWRSWIPALACAVGLSGSNAFHILATHSIPAAEANLLSYLWPVEIVGLGSLLGFFVLRRRQLIGLGMGFAGAVILMGGGAMSLSPTGIGFALLSGVSWAFYCLFRLKWTAAPVAVLSRGCAISTAFCAVLHLLLEPTVVPSVAALASSAAIGIVPLALGNLVWDKGFQRGDSQLLAVMAYATPLCSAVLLAVLGLESFTWSLVVGAVVIVLAGYLSRAEG